MDRIFSIEREHSPKEGLTISATAGIQAETGVLYFSLGAGTDISSETYERPVLYLGAGGSGLSPHRAPGDALVFALEGKAVIGYEGKDYPIEAGQTFRFDKNGLHSVTADGQFKMALLLVLK